MENILMEIKEIEANLFDLSVVPTEEKIGYQKRLKTLYTQLKRNLTEKEKEEVLKQRRENLFDSGIFNDQNLNKEFNQID